MSSVVFFRSFDSIAGGIIKRYAPRKLHYTRPLNVIYIVFFLFNNNSITGNTYKIIYFFYLIKILSFLNLNHYPQFTHISMPLQMWEKQCHISLTGTLRRLDHVWSLLSVKHQDLPGMFCGRCICVPIHFLISSIFSLDISEFFAYSSAAVIGTTDFSLILLDSGKQNVSVK